MGVSSSNNLNNRGNQKNCCKSLNIRDLIPGQSPDPLLNPTPTQRVKCEDKFSEDNRTSMADQITNLLDIDPSCASELAELLETQINDQMQNTNFDCNNYPNHCITFGVIGGGNGGQYFDQLEVCCRGGKMQGSVNGVPPFIQIGPISFDPCDQTPTGDGIGINQ